jgi:hypothetical protein
MSKRSSLRESLLNTAKRTCLEFIVREKFEKSDIFPVQCVEEIPLNVLHKLYKSITNKRCAGESRTTVNFYRRSVTEWIASVRQCGISGIIADRIRYLLSPSEIRKLGLEQYLVEAIVVPRELPMCSDDRIMPTRRLPGKVIFEVGPVDLPSNDVPPMDDSVAEPFESIPEREWEDFDEEQFLIEEVDTEQQFNGFVNHLEQIDELHCSKKTLLEVFRLWLGFPETLGITEAAFSKLFELFQLYKPSFCEDDLRRFPKTGKGLVYLPKKHFANVRFRDLNEYCPATNDFPTQIMKPKGRVRQIPQKVTGRIRTAIEPPAIPPTTKSTEESSDEEDNVSVTSELCKSGSDDEEIVDDDGNEADNEGDDNVSNHSEDELIVEENNDPGDYDGVNAQMKQNEADNKFVQELAYFGIENVLTGKNPGLIDHRGFENVLKAMLVLNTSVLSDFFVDKCFPNPKDINMVSKKTITYQ